MSPLDASFLHIEDAVSHMHIGSVAIFEGPPPTLRRTFAAMVAGKLPRGPALPPEGALRAARARPAGVGRRPALQPRLPPAPHRAAGAGRRRGAAQPRRPGHVAAARPAQAAVGDVDGRGPRATGAGRCVSKVHHCMVDGVSGTDLLTVAARRRARARARPMPDAVARPSAEPSDARSSSRRARRSRRRAPTSSCARRRSATRAPRQAPRSRRAAAAGCATWTASLLRPTPRVVAQRPDRPAPPLGLGAHARSSDVKAIRSALGGTVNDVVLDRASRAASATCCSRAARTSTDRVVRTLVPVSVRTAGERGTYNNRVSAMFAELPVGIADPVERLAAIRAQMDGLKESQAGGGRRGAHVARRASRRRCCSRSARASRRGCRSATSTP